MAPPKERSERTKREATGNADGMERMGEKSAVSMLKFRYASRARSLRLPDKCNSWNTVTTRK